MSLQPSAATGTTHIAPRNGRRLRQFAWIAIALIPVAFIAAMFIGEGLISLQGFRVASSHRSAYHCSPPSRLAL